MDTTTSHPPATEPPQRPTDVADERRVRLTRRRQDRMLAGVAAGLADWLDLDATLVRLGFVGLALVGGLGIPIYLAAWLLVPEEGSEVSWAEELLARNRDR